MKDLFAKADNYATYKDVESVMLWGDKEAVRCPQVSILMPVFNHPDYFRESLASAINQDYAGDYEIVVVDNNDLDGTPTHNQKIVEALNSPKVLYYRNKKNIGMFGNWNRCIELARAPFITYCHDDDMLLPTCLSRLMSLQKKVGRKAVFSVMNRIDEKGNYISRVPSAPQKKWGLLRLRSYFKYGMFDQMLASPGFGVGCLFAKEHMMQLGGYDPDFYPSADYALQARYTQRYGSIYNEVPTFNYRVAENESIGVYEQFAEVDLHFRTCMRRYIPLPNFILDRINKANYNISKVRFAVQWGKKDPALMKTLRPSDRLVMAIAHKCLVFRRYTF